MVMNPFWIRSESPGRLAIVPRPRGGDWLADELRSLRRAGVEVLVSLLTAEETDELGLQEEVRLAGEAGIRFVSFPIPDRSVPASVSAMAGLVKQLSHELVASKAIGIHCRACVGRSALLAACILARQGLTAREAFELISSARGCSVPDTPEQVAWVEAFASNRQ